MRLGLGLRLRLGLGQSGSGLGQSGQSPVGDSARYSSTAPLSSAFDTNFRPGEATANRRSGKNAVNAGRVFVHTSLDAERVRMHSVVDIDPGEPTNMPCLVACEWTQRAPHSFWSNDLAFRNMFFMFSTLETCHFEMSPLNDVAP